MLDFRFFLWRGRRSTAILCAIFALTLVFLLSSSKHASQYLPHRFITKGWSTKGPQGGAVSSPTAVYDATQTLSPGEMDTSPLGDLKSPSFPPHPIDHLMQIANQQVEHLLSKQTKGVAQAAATYRASRGRHPPPKWDQYVRWCEENEVIMIEEFFDPMYRDLGPFWSVAPRLMREFPRNWRKTISIRNGTTKRWENEIPVIDNWMGFWESALSRLPLQDLPDIDLAFNIDDEAKLFPTWETVTAAVSRGNEQRPHSLTWSQGVINEFSTYEKLPARWPNESNHELWKWANIPNEKPIWLVGREACAPDSAARHADIDTDFTRPLGSSLTEASGLAHMYEGFVSNWTAAKSSCENPGVRELHGAWIAMNTNSGEHDDYNLKAVITDLVPLLSGCKISGINGEILIPPALQLPGSTGFGKFGYDFDPDSRVSWEEKENKISWRGSASGGWNTEDNWTRFHRHRFVALTNGSLAAQHYQFQASQKPLPARVPGGEPPLPHNIPLPNSKDVYHIQALQSIDPSAAIEHWVSNVSDTGFVHLHCDPPISWLNTSDCHYTGQFYDTVAMIPSGESFKEKYHPDLDGSSYSGRYRGILQSQTLPMKATIWDEWHDSRLVPWRHFVPMDNSFADWWGLLEYFLGYYPERAEGKPDEARTRPDHDDAARRIAREGSEWVGKVMRTEDQLAWMYRLILELARLSDERRRDMGWVGDLDE